MRSKPGILWFLVFLSVTTVLVRCGSKSKKSDAITTPNASPYVPSDWDGASDWSGNALQVEDIAP